MKRRLQTQCVLLCTLLVSADVFFCSNTSFAGTIQWSPRQDRERILIQLDTPIQNISIDRGDSLNLVIDLPQDEDFSAEGTNPQGEFYHNFQKNGNSLELTMKKSDFGYIYTQPSSNSLLIEIYKDPIASRFYPYEELENTSLIASNPPSINEQEQNTLQNQEPLASASDETQVSENQIIVNSNTSFNSAQVPSLEVVPPLENELEDFSAPIFIPEAETSEPEPAISNEEIFLPNTEDDPLGSLSPASQINLDGQNLPQIQIDDFEEEAANQAQNLSEESAENINIPMPLFDTSSNREIENRTVQAMQNQEATQDSAPNNFTSNQANTIQNLSTQGNEVLLTKEEIEEAGNDIYYGNNFTADLNDSPANSLNSVAVPNYVFQLDQPRPYEVFAFMTKEVGAPKPASATRNLLINTHAVNPQSTNSQTSSAEEFALVEVAEPQSTNEEILNEQNLAPSQSDQLAAEITQTIETEDLDDISTSAATQEADELEGLSIEEKEALAEKQRIEAEIQAAREANMTIVYQDAEGNIVEEPPNIPKLIEDANEAYELRRYLEVIEIIDKIKTYTLSENIDKHNEILEDLLYKRMNAEFFIVDEMNAYEEEGQKVITLANEALNFNPRSSKTPQALEVLVRTHLNLKNLEDAKGYALMMKNLYPDEPETPELLYILAQEYLRNADYAQSAELLNYIITDYSSHPLTEDAAIAQAYAFYKQGQYDKALPVIEFVNLRWPDAYINNPDFLPMSADVQISQEKYEDALRTLWTQYNIDPTNAYIPETLNKIALLYYTLGNKEAAEKVELEILNMYPDSIFAPMALLRLAEGTFTPPNPSLETLLQVFSMPNPRIPSINYQIILDDYPDSPEAIDALTRLGALAFYNKDYSSALLYAKRIIDNYPDRVQYNVAFDVLLRSFAHTLANALSEENYARALSLWEEYPLVHDYYLPLENDLRVALARGYLNRGDTAQGLELLTPFINPAQDPVYGLYAYNLFLANYVAQNNWPAILELDKNVNSWNMPLDVRNQHEYTTALAAQNLGNTAKALPLWQNLSANTQIPLYQRAYATYFLARDAESKQDLRMSYQHNLDALAMFEQLQEESSPYADQQRIRESIAALIDVTEVAGRFQESLDWLNKYSVFVPETSPDYAGLQLREARLYRKMNDMTTWQRLLEEVIAREPDSVFGQMAASELSTEQLARDINNLTQ